MSIMMRSVAAALLFPAFLCAQPAFEAASLKPHDPKTAFFKGRILPGGGLEAAGLTLEDLLSFAYGMLPDKFSGLPKWAHESQFDIIAKAPRDTPPSTVRLMLRALLAERFKLTSHEETRPMPAYILTVGKQGRKLTPASGTQPRCSWIALPAGVSRRDCQNLSMAELARQLPGLGGIGVDLPVVDNTGLDGSWDFHLDVRLLPPSSGATSAHADSAVPEGPSIFDAFEQIGLKLERRKVPLPVLVVDHIEPLAEN